MAQSPHTTNPSSELVFGGVVSLAVVAALVALGVFLTKHNAGYHQEVHCPTIAIDHGSQADLLDIINQASAKVGVPTPSNAMRAIVYSPQGVMDRDSIRVCFDSEKQFIASIGGERTPKE